MSKSTKCHNCGGENTCRIVYGMVDYDEAMERREAAGKVYLGGCCVELDDEGRQLKVTIAKWYTPNGVNINKEGIAPDKEVKISDEDAKAGKDTQKDAALTQLRQ